MNKKIYKQLPTRVRRVYRGGKRLDAFLGNTTQNDGFYPEDWISSFVEAKNKEYIAGEGLSLVMTAKGKKPLAELVSKADFGQDREDSGVLIKLLDASERLGIQVHPTKEYAQKVFGSKYGKTECWYILEADEGASVYLGFREHITREKWEKLFKEQDIDGMLSAMHKFNVKTGDCILVTGGTPHAIGSGCFLIEIQEPSDYTMRAEKTTPSGIQLTPQQIHYGVGEEKMLDCFSYRGLSMQEIKNKYFPQSVEVKKGLKRIIGYEHTPCFALYETEGETISLRLPHFVTLIAKSSAGSLVCDGESFALLRGDRFFITANTSFTVRDANVILCFPPENNFSSNER